jgi:hypothetical protein
MRSTKRTSGGATEIEVLWALSKTNPTTEGIMSTKSTSGGAENHFFLKNRTRRPKYQWRGYRD